MHYVIGSGPAGVACARALLDRGVRVCMVDAGLTLEPAIQDHVRQLHARTPDQWSKDEIKRLKGDAEANSKGVVLKRSFGSDFPYRGTDEHIGITSEDAALKPSLAFGGLSNVWGAAMLPYTESDLQGWPIHLADLAPHYAAALRLTGLAAGNDALEETFPLYAEAFATLRKSRQSERLWRNLMHHKQPLEQSGITFGASRIAVRDCAYCGLCMYGCAYGYIFNSAATVQQMRQEERFSYESGVIVTRIEESNNQVTISGYRMENGAPWEARAERAFLAAGVLPTTKILLSSQEAFDQPRWIADSQYFLFPLAQFSRTPGVRDEALHTLSQIFLEICDAQLSPHTVHIQLYSYNDIISQALRATLGPLGVDWIVRQLEERVLIAQAYLHSDLSPRIRIVLEKTARGSQLRMETEPNPETEKRVRSVVRKLLRHARQLGAVPLEPMLQVAPTGRGFHSGGTFPMRREPTKFETDILGRPQGYERIHVVDASVFPTIPATTITLSAMANAHRIASLALS